MKIDREQAIKIIAANEIENISKEDRELLIYNIWAKSFKIFLTLLRKNTLLICGEYNICSCCSWEDDGIIDEEKYSNPNHMTLKQGKDNYRLYGQEI